MTQSLKNHFPHKGFVDAADGSGHRVYFEEYGPRAAPAHVMVHGNVGALFDVPKLSMWDFDRDHVVILHARGIGESTPAALLTANNYPDLARDIETVRAHLDLGQIGLFGWSGGTAVSLLYAEEYPQHCRALTLYGTYTGTQQEILSYYDGVRKFYPDGWNRFCDHYGTRDVTEVISRSNKDILAGSLDAAIRYEMIFEPAGVGMEEMKTRHSPVDWRRILENRMVFSHMMEELYGLTPNQIERGVGAIGNIPVLFINGQHDTITPPEVAHRLASQLPKATLLTAPDADHDIHGAAAQSFMKTVVNEIVPPRIEVVRPAGLVMKP